MLDSEPVFTARLHTVGLPKNLSDTLVANGINTMAKLAYLAPVQPGTGDDSKFFEALTPLMGFNDSDNKMPAAIISTMRRIWFEAHATALSEVRSRIEKPDDQQSKKLPLPEREAKRLKQQASLTGIRIQGPLEPAHSVIDALHSMKDDDILRYLDPSQCISREMELKGTKKEAFMKVDQSGKLHQVQRDLLPEADLSTEYRVRQALQRRSLALDQMQLLDYSDSESYHDFLYQLLMKEIPPSHHPISMKQLLEADRQVWLFMAGACRSGISRQASGVLPMQRALADAMMDPVVLSMLQPLPKAKGHDSSNVNVFTNVRKPWQQSSSQYHDQDQTKGKGFKGSKGGKGQKGKGKQSKNRFTMPTGLEGGHSRTSAGSNICFGFNLAGCPDATMGGKCSKGLHICCRCEAKDHSFQNCPKKS